MKKILSIFSKIFFFPGKIVFPLFLFASGSKRTSSVLMAKSILENSFLRKSGEFIFSLIVWGLIISCFFSSSGSEKKVSEVRAAKTTEVKPIENLNNERQEVVRTIKHEDAINSREMPVAKNNQYQNENKELQRHEKKSISSLHEIMEKMKQNASKTKSAHFNDEPEYLK